LYHLSIKEIGITDMVDKLKPITKFSDINGPCIFQGYHHSFLPDKLELDKISNNRVFSLCDNPNQWLSPHISGEQIYLVTVRLDNPKIWVMEKELVGTRVKKKNVLKPVRSINYTLANKIRKEGYDSYVFYTDNPNYDQDYYVRELCIFEAHGKVLDVKLHQEYNPLNAVIVDVDINSCLDYLASVKGYYSILEILNSLLQYTSLYDRIDKGVVDDHHLPTRWLGRYLKSVKAIDDKINVDSLVILNLNIPSRVMTVSYLTNE
jgi:hypothetical protein